MEMLPFSLTCADLALIALEPGVGSLCFPSKVYNILASGTPVLVLAEETADIAVAVRTAQCGTVVRPRDASVLAQAILMYAHNTVLRNEQGRNGRRYFEQHFTIERVADEYYSILQALSA
jgi:glycosyltransferase involved in cell wall biosynthesis